jgi:hypothetical protein
MAAATIGRDAMKGNFPLQAFNRGEIAPEALARIDLGRMRLSAEEQVNWLPRALGAMKLRPGLQYIMPTRNNAAARYIPFVFSNTDTALLECSASSLRPLVNEAPIIRSVVSTVIPNGDFSSDGGWTLDGEGGGNASISGGLLTMAATPLGSYITCVRTFTVADTDRPLEHGMRVSVVRGPVIFRLGTSAGGDELIRETTLQAGVHSLAFTPNVATVHLTIEGRVNRPVIVDSVSIDQPGELVLPTSWDATNLPMLRWAQSGDVVFVACLGRRPQRIERRGLRSWSLVEYVPTDGPFGGLPAPENIKLALTEAIGSTTMTSTRPYFRPDHVGAIFRVFTTGYNRAFPIGAEDTFTPPIRVTGVGASRTVGINIQGTFTGTITLQESYDSADTGFTDVDGKTYSAPGADTYINGENEATDQNPYPNANVIVWIRAGFKAGDYTSGTAVVTLTYGASGSSSGRGGARSTGGRAGVCRVTGYNSSTSVSADVLEFFSSDVASANWSEGEWSDRAGWPSAVAFHEGRLFWAGGDRIWGSVSDAFSSFSPDAEGESGPIQRSIGYGPVSVINWLLPLSRLLVGTEASEVAVRSSSFDEPLTPTNFSLKDISTQGSSRLPGLKIDTRGLFIDKSGQRLMEMAFRVDAGDYSTNDLTMINPTINLNNPVVEIVVQRQPDTRIHCIRQDGTVAVLVYEPAEEVMCWWRVETDGHIEGAVVLPGDSEDQVYYVVRRTAGGTRRYLERFAREDQCGCGDISRQMDAFVTYSGPPTTTIGGLSHLNGRNVVAWGDGRDLGSFTVVSGGITLPTAVRNCAVGLAYQARFKSAKLAYAAGMGTALTQKKRVNYLGVILHETHYQGLRYGPDFNTLDDLPLVEDGAVTDADAMWTQYDKTAFEFPGRWDEDSRLCLVAQSPRPCTVLGAVVGLSTHDKG